MPLRILSGKGAVQIMPFRKLGGKCHFLLRCCTRKRSETYTSPVPRSMWSVFIADRKEGNVLRSVSQSFCSRGGGEEGGILSLPVCSHVPSGRGVSAPRGYLLPGGGAGMASWYWHLVAAIAAVGTHPTEIHSSYELKLDGMYLSLESKIQEVMKKVTVTWMSQINLCRTQRHFIREIECAGCTFTILYHFSTFTILTWSSRVYKFVQYMTEHTS